MEIKGRKGREDKKESGRAGVVDKTEGSGGREGEKGGGKTPQEGGKQGRSGVGRRQFGGGEGSWPGHPPSKTAAVANYRGVMRTRWGRVDKVRYLRVDSGLCAGEAAREWSKGSGTIMTPVMYVYTHGVMLGDITFSVKLPARTYNERILWYLKICQGMPTRSLEVFTEFARASIQGGRGH